MLEDLKKYLRETPQAELQKEWTSLSRFDNVGPTVTELFESWKTFYDEDYYEFLKYPEPEKVEINKSEAPDFVESFFLTKIVL